MTNLLHKPRILVADHDQTFLDQLADRLLQMNMEVDFAENGRTAIQLIESESYDLILTEIAMPIYNGLEILRCAKEHHPGIPILITSFSATTDWAEQAIREGAHSYLLRPFNDMTTFEHAVKEALQTRQVPKAETFFHQIFSKDVYSEPSPTQADIPMPNWEQGHDVASSKIDLNPSRPQPMNPFPYAKDKITSNQLGHSEKTQESQAPLPEGAIELNSEGQILNCDTAARKWLMLEANTSDRPIRCFIKSLGSTSAPTNAELKLNGRYIRILTHKIADRMGSERIILRINEMQKQGSGPSAASKQGHTPPLKRSPAKAESAVAFSSNLKKYNPDTVDQGWSPLIFIDQMKKTIKDEVHRIKENNPLKIFEPQPEEVDPEVLMTMSRRLSDVGRGNSTSYR